MAHIVFYEKPGCADDSRQKAWLAAGGHTIEAPNLLTHPWTFDELLRFFGPRQVPGCFKRGASPIKSGAVKPEALDASNAPALLVADPLSIRRPLIEAKGRREADFDLVL